MIYFVRAADSDAIKIGYAEDVSARIQGMQTGNHKELILLAVMPGEQCDEAEIHQRFAASRLQGEWFEETQPLLNLIDVARETFDQERAFAQRRQRVIPTPPRQVSALDVNRELMQLMHSIWGDTLAGAKRLAADVGVACPTARNWIDGRNAPNGFALIRMMMVSREFCRGVLDLVEFRKVIRTDREELHAALSQLLDDVERSSP